MAFPILPAKTKLKVGVALSGGSALGNAHIGALQALEDHHIPINCIAGTSAGAVVAACYAFGVPLAEIASRAKNLSWFKLSNFSYSRKGLVSTETIKKLILEILGPVAIEQAKIPLAIVATNIQTGESVIFKKGSVADAVCASVCIPGLFVPVEINGIQLVDGGLVENLPLSPLDDLGANVKIGVNLSRWRTYKQPNNFVEVMINTLDIMTFRQTNILAKNAQIDIEPHLEGYSSLDFKKSAELIAEGYRTATLAIPQIQKVLRREPSLPPARADFLHRLWKIFTQKI